MDATDRQILLEMQDNGRLSLTELAERINLSISPTHRRLRDLESSGAITGYSARLDAHSLGLTFEALVFVTMREATRESLTAFEEAVREIPHILQAQRLFGDPDYLLRVVAADLAAYERIYDDQLTGLPGMQRMTSTLVMKSVVENRRLPL